MLRLTRFSFGVHIVPPGRAFRNEGSPEGIASYTHMRVCVVGSTMIDFISRVPRLPVAGETLAGTSFTTSGGGKGANAALTAARLGAAVTFVTRVGNDTFGERALAAYREAGIDCSFIVRDPERPTGVATICVDDAARNTIVIVGGANDALSPGDAARAGDAIARADVVVAQLEVPLETVGAAFAAARRAGVRTLLNPAPARPLPAEVLALTDVIVPNETEAAALTGLAPDGLDGAFAAAQALCARGLPVAVITCGARGAVAVTGDRCVHVPPLAVAAVDSTGAGDAFVGTLALGLAAGADIDAAMRWANAIAALSVTRLGAQPSFPQRAEADAYLATLGLTLPRVSGETSARH